MHTGEILDDKYEILERLGAGGMGEVYKATHRYLGSTRVIKVIRPNVSDSTDAQERFVHEARAATKVQHANVAMLHDFSRLPEGSHYMVWEYIDGENLAQRLRARGTLPPFQAVHIALQALHGLEAIHRAGIVHRDISPENLMIAHDGDVVKIIDLGVAKVEGASSTAQTQTGMFIGKFRYASPEQLGFLPEGEKIDGRTDLYAMAMVLVEMLTGRPPYEAKSPHEYFIHHAQEPQLKTVELPPDLPGSAALQEILEKALARDRNRRWATASEFAAALEEVGRSLPDPASFATLAIRLHAQTTMRMTPPATGTLPGPTVRTASAAAPTVRTPIPVPTPAVGGSRSEKRRSPLLWIAALLLVAVAVAGTLMYWPREPPSLPVQEAIPQKPVVRAEEPAQATITVTSAEVPVSTTVIEEPAALTQTPPRAATATSPAVHPPLHAPTDTRAATRAPAVSMATGIPADVAKTEASATEVETYVDGGGDGEVNDRAVEHLQEEVRGVTRVEVQGGAMQQELVSRIKDRLEHVEVVASASVVIRFDGAFERLGRGRKKRAAHATITKNGRVVFRYELPELVYRVGMTPAEAFTRVISDAFVE